MLTILFEFRRVIQSANIYCSLFQRDQMWDQERLEKEYKTKFDTGLTNDAATK